MRRVLLSLSSVLFFFTVLAQNYLPYPVIFVHGLTGSDQTFATTFNYMSETFELDQVNVYDIVLNADNDEESALMSQDVKWEDFTYSTWYGDRYINLGPRSYADDMDDYQDGWSGVGNLFAINFKEERIRGAAGTLNDLFDYSDQAAIFKQGYALRQLISEVLQYTGAEKVILVGHSMGGLAIREYLQRTDENGIHVNWIDPYSADGHKVAAVITYGTPHLGSNAGLDPTKSAIPNEHTEAVRDLKYSYDEYTNCDGEPVGIYLFGGYEYCIQSTWWNSTFFNVDVNCDGDEDDYIVGIDYETYDNPLMPLPTNFPYTWITSLWADVGGNLVGDGVVNINRQWLHIDDLPAPVGIADTMLTNLFHTDEPDDYPTIIRALDEPENPQFAYKLDFGKNYLGFITFQPGYYPYDVDYFKVDVQSVDAIKVWIKNQGSGVDEVEVLDPDFNLLAWVNPQETDSVVAPTNGNSFVYLRVSGTATSSTWNNPYHLKISAVENWVTEANQVQSLIRNIATGQGKVEIRLSMPARVQVFDVSGKLIKAVWGQNVQLSVQPQGFYIIKAIAGSRAETVKVFVR